MTTNVTLARERLKWGRQRARDATDVSGTNHLPIQAFTLTMGRIVLLCDGHDDDENFNFQFFSFKGKES